MKRLFLAFPLVSLACSTPVTVVRTMDDRPKLLLQGAPDGATLQVDGRRVGKAAAFSGTPGVCQMEPGVHLLEVRLGDKVLVSQKVFFGGGEQRTLVVPQEIAQ